MGSIGGEELLKMEKMNMACGREEKILVLVRLRPLSEKEIEVNEVADWECINDTTILYRNTLREGCTFPSAYTFDRVFRGDCSTRQVYDAGAKEVALSVVNGINSSIFAYGQTSSGKTYTMTGITEYAVADIFDYMQRHEERAFVLKFSAIEIYNEAIRDLLSTDNAQLRLLDDPEKGTIVEKATEETLKDWNHLQELLSVCEAQRRIGETSLNEKSSRSHQILRLSIESSSREFLGKENSTTLAATVNFVDLAGSERASQALSSGTRLKEGCHINRSLLTLGTVIRKLSNGRHGHINYRDSKLTRLLQPALGGNARTAIICTLSPARSHVEQTRNTLLFACCAKEVTTKAQVNVVMSDKALVKHLQKELARLESELRSPAPASTTGDYPALLRKKDLQIQKMDKEIKELTKQRDLAESRVQDLLRIIEDDKNQAAIKNQPLTDSQEDEYSVSESSVTSGPRQTNGAVRKFSMENDADSESNEEESCNNLQENTEEQSLSGEASSEVSFGKKNIEYNSHQRPHCAAVGATSDSDDYCKEVQCIEPEGRENNTGTHTSNIENEGNMVSTVVTTQDLSVAVIADREASQNQNGSTYDMLEQRLHLVQSTIDSFVTPFPEELPSPSLADMSSADKSKLNRSWSCREAEQIESTPPDVLEKNFSVRPEGSRRRIPPLNFASEYPTLSRNDSISSCGSAFVEDIPSIQTFVAGMKQFVDDQVHATEKSTKSIGIDPMNEASETMQNLSFEFEKQQREILELWQACNVSLIHRTYFFLLFKGDPTDSIYMEVELRRLSFLKESFSKGNMGVRDRQDLTLASSVKALHRERITLSKLMHKRLTDGERKRLYEGWGITLSSKRRSLQLTNHLWTNTKDMDHIRESAAIVAKLIKLVEQGQALKEMFGLSFTPPSTRRRSLGWTYSRSSLL